MQYLKKIASLYSTPLKIVLQWSIYSRYHKNPICKWSEFPPKNWPSLKKHKKEQYLKKYTFLHSTPLNKRVLEWSIYSIETTKNV